MADWVTPEIDVTDAFATQALAHAAASLAYSLAIDAALAVQSDTTVAASNTFAHTRNGLIQQYGLAMENANSTKMKAEVEAHTQELVTIANAAASAWANSAGSGDPYAAYYAAYNAAQYTYDAAVAEITATAWKASIDAQTQWVQDVSGGWLTYWNDLADHAQTAADATTAAALLVTDTMAANAFTFAQTVIPAIRTAVDAEVNNGYQAITSAAGFATTYTSNKLANAFTSTGTEISAWQSLQGAYGDHWEQQVNLDAAAGVTLAGVNAGIIAQLITPTQIGQVQALQFGYPPVAQLTKEEFDAELRRLVEEAGISGQRARDDLRQRDPHPDLLDDGSTRRGKPGFDCDDFVHALKFFLNRKLTRGQGVTMSLLGATYTMLDGTANGHQFLVVERGGLYWLVNATRGTVDGEFTSIAALKDKAKDLLVEKYDANLTTIVLTSYNSRAEFQTAIPDEPEPWYTNPLMRQRFNRYCSKYGIDPSPFYPPGWYPIPLPPDYF